MYCFFKNVLVSRHLIPQYSTSPFYQIYVILNVIMLDWVVFYFGTRAKMGESEYLFAAISIWRIDYICSHDFRGDFILYHRTTFSTPHPLP